MALVLWSHPFSSYCQKVIVALYETGLPFEARLVDFGDPASAAAFRAVWPIAKMPVLVDSERGVTLPEATIAIEHLHRLKPEAGLLPRDAQAELKTRLLDRVFDNYVQTPMQKIVGDRLRPADQEDAYGVAEARDQLRITYGMLERELADGRSWAIGAAFTLADCAAAPALFYADLVEPFRHDWPKLAAYFDRLTKRPSFARAVHEAAPFMPHFPKPRGDARRASAYSLPTHPRPRAHEEPMPNPLDPSLDFLVLKSDWKTTRFVEAPAPADLAPGRVLFRVDRFALTANNITYALAGDSLGYWRFFPAPDGWGRIPVMGFGDVVRSTHPGVAEGTRCFGWFPMSRYLVIEPSRVTPEQIVDGAPHRAGIAPVYGQYTPVLGDALYSAEHEDAQLVLRGLFLTSFLVEDFLTERDGFGARDVLISSASSKTSIALAFQVSQRGRARAIGLTSTRNRGFVKSLGCYEHVLSYDEIGALSRKHPAVFVDMAGNGDVVRAIHEHLGDALKYSCTVGVTHWEAPRTAQDLPGPKTEFFFAPTQVQKRVKDWGAEGFQQRAGSAWRAFRDESAAWLQVVRASGRDALARVYQDTLAGRTRPQDGHVLSLWDR